MEDELIRELGALQIAPGAYGPVSRELPVDMCAPNNITMQANTPDEMRNLLTMRFGETELQAMLQDDALCNM